MEISFIASRFSEVRKSFITIKFLLRNSLLNHSNSTFKKTFDSINNKNNTRSEKT